MDITMKKRPITMKTLALVGLLGFSPGLAFAGVDGSTAKITSAISSGSVDSIIAELERAENIPTRGAFDAVMKLIDFPNDRVREAAGWWLTRRGIRQEVIKLAEQRLNAEDPVAAGNVLDTLRGMRDVNTLDLVATYAAHPLDETSGIAAFRCIGAIGSPAGLTAIQSGAGSTLAGVRAQALRAVRELRAPVGQKVLTSGTAYVALLADADDSVRREAAYTLGYLGQHGLNTDATSSGLNALVGTLKNDSSPKVRKAAAWALGELGLVGGLDALHTAQSDSDASVRSMARAAAGSIH